MDYLQTRKRHGLSLCLPVSEGAQTTCVSRKVLFYRFNHSISFNSLYCLFGVPYNRSIIHVILLAISHHPLSTLLSCTQPTRPFLRHDSMILFPSYPHQPPSQPPPQSPHPHNSSLNQ